MTLEDSRRLLGEPPLVLAEDGDTAKRLHRPAYESPDF